MKTIAKHQIGDIHPNGLWIWTEWKPGHFDWKSKNGKYHRNNATAVAEEKTAPVAQKSEIKVKNLIKKAIRIKTMTPNEFRKQRAAENRKAARAWKKEWELAHPEEAAERKAENAAKAKARAELKA